MTTTDYTCIAAVNRDGALVDCGQPLFAGTPEVDHGADGIDPAVPPSDEFCAAHFWLDQEARYEAWMEQMADAYHGGAR